jgi:hypothetical protein
MFQGQVKHIEDHQRLDIVTRQLTAGQVLTSANGTVPTWETARGTWANRPASPYDKQMYRATDRKITYEYDSGLGIWLSEASTALTLAPTPGITFPANATATAVMRVGRPDDVYSIYVEKFIVRAVTNTTLDVTNNWTITANKQDSANVITVLGTANTYQATRVANTNYLNVITVGAVHTVTAAYGYHLDLTMNAAPGTLGFHPAVMTYRLVG